MIRIFLLCLTLLSSHVLATETVRIYGYGIKQSTYVDSSKELRGKNHGGRPAFLTELLRELMISLKNAPDIRPVEQDVQFSQLELKAAQAILGINRTINTEEHYKWMGPLLTDSAYFLNRKGSSATINSLEGARKASSICVRKGTPQVLALKKMGFDNLQLASSYASCWESVAEGKAELTTISALLFPAITASVGNVSEKIANTGVRLYDDEVYLAFSNDTSDALIEQWVHALEEIKLSRQYHSLVHHYYCRQDCF